LNANGRTIFLSGRVFVKKVAINLPLAEANGAATRSGLTALPQHHELSLLAQKARSAGLVVHPSGQLRLKSRRNR
jgi:hypothetical protein